MTPASAFIPHLGPHFAIQPGHVLVWVGISATQINFRDLQICSTEMMWLDQQSGTLSPCSLCMGSTMSPPKSPSVTHHHPLQWVFWKV